MATETDETTDDTTEETAHAEDGAQRSAAPEQKPPNLTPSGKRRGRPPGSRTRRRSARRASRPSRAPAAPVEASLETIAEGPPLERAAAPEEERKPEPEEKPEPSQSLAKVEAPAWRDPARIRGVAPLAQTMLCTGIAMACHARGYEPPDWSEVGPNGKTLGQALGEAGGAVVLKRFPWFESMAEELTLFGLIGLAMEKARPIGEARGPASGV